MTKIPEAKPTAEPVQSAPTTKNQQVINLLSREGGATLEEMSKFAGWQPHSTRSFMTGLKKKGHAIDSAKVDGVRRYRIVLLGNE